MPGTTDAGAGTEQRPEVERRRAYTAQRWEALSLVASDKFVDGEAVTTRSCIYVTGSMARDEATEGSDLDLFVIDRLSKDSAPLSYVETSHLIAHLDDVRGDAKFRPFSRGGEFVRTHSLESLLELIGDPMDDAQNAFTARILLLINSRPLTNRTAYDEARKRILDSYWIPQSPKDDFRPIMLVNDIRRWWGVLCLNFERYNKQVVIDEYTAHSPVDRRIANLKLRFARLMAAYTPIIGLIHSSSPEGLVKREDCESVLDDTPIGRLKKIEIDESAGNDAQAAATELLNRYDRYLAFMNQSKDDLQRSVSKDATWHPEKVRAYEFHREFVRLYGLIGNGKALYEYSLV